MACACKRGSTSAKVGSSVVRKSAPSNNSSRRNGRIVKRLIK